MSNSLYLFFEANVKTAEANRFAVVGENTQSKTAGGAFGLLHRSFYDCKVTEKF